MKLSRLLILGLTLFAPIFGWAEQQTAVERTYRFEDPTGQNIRTVVRDVSISDTSKQTGLRQTQMFVNSALRDSTTESYYNVRASDGRTSSYSAPIEESRRAQYDRQLNETFSAQATGGGLSLTYNYQREGSPYPPSFGESLHDNQNSWSTQVNKDYFTHQAQENERRDSLDRDRQFDRKLGDRLNNSATSVAASTLGALGAAQDMVKRNLGRDAVPILTGIKMNSDAQAAQINAYAEALVQGNFAKAALIDAELSSPLLENPSARTKTFVSSRRDENVDQKALPHFSSPELEHRKIVISKLLDYAYGAKPQLKNPRGNAWVRASLYLVQAAGVAAQRGDTKRASRLLSQAQSIAGLLAGVGEPGGLSITQNQDFAASDRPLGTIYAQASAEQVTLAAMNTFLNEVSPNLGVSLNPHGEFQSEATLNAITQQLDKTVAPEQRPYLDVAKNALSKISAFAKSPEGVEVLKQTALLSLDVVVGLWAPSAIIRDCVEFSTGRNYRTGLKITPVERAIAVLGIMTLGTVSTSYKVAKGAIVIAEDAVEANRAFRAGEKIGETLKAIKADTPGFVRSLRAEIAQGKTAAEQTEIINDITRTVRDRSSAIKLEGEVVGYARGSALNEIESAKAAPNGVIFQPAYVPEDHAMFIALTKAPADTGEELIRIHRDVNQKGAFLMRKADAQGLTIPQVLDRWNIPPGPHGDLPIFFSTPNLKAGDGLIISGAAKNAFGTENNFLQFQIERIEPYHYSGVRPQFLPLDSQGRIDFNILTKASK